MKASLIPFVSELLPRLRTFSHGEYGIALGGAHAKGADDAESDIDLYVFARDVLPIHERDRLCAQFSLEISRVVSWDAGSSVERPFTQGGTDFYYRGQKIEVWFRNIDYVSGIISACQEGAIHRDYVTWTVMGFFNYCTLSDLHKMVPVEDPGSLLARWKAEVSVYPPKMKQRILREYLAAARFWPDNFHYKTAVARCDILYTSGIVQQVVHNLIQVVFALNETYFPGEKKLEASLEHLPSQPHDFTRRIQALVFPAVEPSRETLEDQRKELVALVGEVEALITLTE